MVFVGDITIGEGESIPPSTQFVKVRGGGGDKIIEHFIQNKVSN